MLYAAYDRYVVICLSERQNHQTVCSRRKKDWIHATLYNTCMQWKYSSPLRNVKRKCCRLPLINVSPIRIWEVGITSGTSVRVAKKIYGGDGIFAALAIFTALVVQLLIWFISQLKKDRFGTWHGRMYKHGYNAVIQEGGLKWVADMHLVITGHHWKPSRFNVTILLNTIAMKTIVMTSRNTKRDTRYGVELATPVTWKVANTPQR